MAKKPEYVGVVEKDGKYVCDKCGSDGISFVAHIDGKEFFANMYNCIKCGNPISVKSYRRGEDKAYWS